MLLLAAVNPRPAVALRLLTLRTQPLPLGVWLAAGSAGGALLSALATTLALWDGRRRSSRSRPETREVWSEQAWARSERDPHSEPKTVRSGAPEPELWPQAGPERPPGEPAPTVSVPFRVIRRAPTAAAAGRGASASAAAASFEDDWQTNAEGDDW